MGESARAEVRQIPSDSRGKAFQTFDLLVPAGRHWQVDGGFKETRMFLYCPTNEELQSIAIAARGELDRRRDAEVAEIDKAYEVAAVSACEQAAVREVAQ